MMTIRRLAAFAAIPALTAGMLGALAPTAAAQPNQTRQVPITHSCVGVPYPSLFGLFDNASTVSESLEVTAPDRVDPGTTFTVQLQPGQMSVERAIARTHYDFAVPAGATLSSYKVVPNTAQGIAGAPQLTRINANGSASNTGQFLRLSAQDATVYNRSNWAQSNIDSTWAKGIRAGAGQNFRLPAIELTLRAPNTEGQITTGLRTGPATPAEGNNTSMGFLTEFGSVKQFGVAFTIGHANYCSVTGAGRGALSTTNVHTVTSTATDIDVQLEALTGDDVRITAAVTPNPGAGTVEFYDGDTVIGESELGADGSVELVWKFREKGEHPITARYVGDAKHLPSQSDEKVVAVTVPGEVVIEPDPEPEPPIVPSPEDPSGTGSLGSITDLFAS